MELNFTEILDSDSLVLSIDKIQISFIPQTDTLCLAFVSISSSSGSSIKSSDIKLISENFSLSSIERIRIGRNAAIGTKVTYFLQSLHDIQIFQGGFFLRSVSDPNLIEAFALKSPHHVSCDSNPYFLRQVYDINFDEYYFEQLKKHPLCQDRIINMNCLIDNFEMCAESICFVCLVPYVLENNTCIDKSTQFDKLEFDIFTRLSLSDLGMIQNTEFYDLPENIKISIPNDTEFMYFRITYDSVPDTSYLNQIYLYFEKYTDFGVNPSTINQGLKDLYFSWKDLNTFYFVLNVKKTPIEVMITGRNASLEVSHISVDCNKLQTVEFLPNILNLNPCKNFFTGFSSTNLYMASLIDSPPPFFYADYFISYSKYKISLGCKNNCDCSSSYRFLSCGDNYSACSDNNTLQYVSQSPLISMCIPSCDSSCDSCIFSHCLECSFDHFSVSEYTLDKMFPGITF